MPEVLSTPPDALMYQEAALLEKRVICAWVTRVVVPVPLLLTVTVPVSVPSEIR